MSVLAQFAGGSLDGVVTRIPEPYHVYEYLPNPYPLVTDQEPPPPGERHTQFKDQIAGTVEQYRFKHLIRRGAAYEDIRFYHYCGGAD